MATKYVSLHVTDEARSSLQRLQLQLSLDVGRRLSLAETLVTAVAVTERHSAEAVAALSPSADPSD